jgi:hypothetical protein
MASDGPNNPSVATGTGWDTPNNIFAADAVFTWADPAGVGELVTAGGWLFISGFGFSVPEGATILGFEYTIKGKYTVQAASGGVEYYSVKLLKTGPTVGDTLAVQTVTTSNIVRTFGGPTELGGLTWTREEAQHADTGIRFRPRSIAGSDPAFNYKAWMDHVTGTVYYSEAASGPPVGGALLLGVGK